MFLKGEEDGKEEEAESLVLKKKKSSERQTRINRDLLQHLVRRK